MTNVIIGFASAITFILIIYIHNQLLPVDQKYRLRGQKWRLPPGPEGKILLGNLARFTQARASGSLNRWLDSMRSYGEMTTLHMGSQLWVLLNSDIVISDIISRRSKITNERPDMPISSGLVSHNRRSVIQKEKDWFEARAAMSNMLTKSSLQTYASYLESECVVMMASYLERPDLWYVHHSRYATAMSYRIVAGEPLAKSSMELDEHRQVTMEFLTSLFQSYVDFFPILASLPQFLQPWREHWQALGDNHQRVFRNWWYQIRANVRAGTTKACFARDVLLNPDSKYPGDEEDKLYLANSIIAAGGDNTRMTMNAFVMACITYPATLKRAREELDQLCGRAEQEQARLPKISDMHQTRYLCALMKEVIRWRPVVPLLPPHQLTEDLQYGGYCFPKGTNFFINGAPVGAGLGSLNEFNPDRWLDGNEHNIVHNCWGFGGGRRICAGYRIAQQALYLAFSNLVYCFDFAPNGLCDSSKLNPWSRDEPFPVQIKCRSEAHAKLVSREAGLKKDSKQPPDES